MYLNLVQLAESFGVSEGVVESWIRHEGLPHTPDRGRLLFDRAQVAEWATKRGLTAKAGFLAQEAPALSANLRLGSLLRHGGIWRGLSATEMPSVLEKIVAALPGVTPPVRQLLRQRLGAKDGLNLAPVGNGFALPHPSSRVALGRDSGTVALLILSDALAAADNAPDAHPINRLFFFIAPSPRLHLDLLARLSRSLVREPLRERVLKAASDADILEAMDAVDASLAVESKSEVKP
ncbi:MAG TPA: PTS sugar transporter subunit IIA [Terriglobia bacterium]|nr:PTS sugar transporter subunit IIA [Terriglobia bacterium]